MKRINLIKHAQISLILLCVSETAFSKTGQIKLGGNTPKLEVPILVNEKKPTDAVKLEVLDKVSRSSEHSYGHALEMEKRDSLTRQKVYLKIKITNLLSKSANSLTIKYRIYGGERKTDPFRATQIGKTSLAGSGELTLKEPLKFGESKILKTKPYFFDMEMKSTSVIIMNKGGALVQTLSGSRYIGYQVAVYDEKNILVAEKNNKVLPRT